MLNPLNSHSALTNTCRWHSRPSKCTLLSRRRQKSTQRADETATLDGHSFDLLNGQSGLAWYELCVRRITTVTSTFQTTGVDAKLSLYTFDISIQRITTALFSSSKHLSAWQTNPHISLSSMHLALILTYIMHHRHACSHRSKGHELRAFWGSSPVFFTRL